MIPIQILWCNLHGGFLVGLGLIGFYIIGEALSRKPFIPYVMVLALSSVATLINPYGIEYWWFFPSIFTHASTGAYRMVRLFIRL